MHSSYVQVVKGLDSKGVIGDCPLQNIAPILKISTIYKLLVLTRKEFMDKII